MSQDANIFIQSPRILLNISMQEIWDLDDGNR